MKNYWTVLRILRSAKTPEQRRDLAKSTVTVTMFTEPDPRLKARLQATIQEELQRRA